MNFDDPVMVMFGDEEIGIGVIASDPEAAGKILVQMDGDEPFEIGAPAAWFDPTPMGGYLLRLPPRT